MSRLEAELRSSLEAEKKKTTMYEQKLRHTVEAFKKLKSENDTLEKLVVTLNGASNNGGDLEKIKKEFTALTNQLKEKEHSYMASNKLLAAENSALKQKLGNSSGLDKATFEEAQKKFLYAQTKIKLFEKPLGPNDSLVKLVCNIIEEKDLALTVATETNTSLKNDIIAISNENARLRENMEKVSKPSDHRIDNQLEAILRECDEKQQSIQQLENQVSNLTDEISALKMKSEEPKEKLKITTIKMNISGNTSNRNKFLAVIESFSKSELEELKERVESIESYINDVQLFVNDRLEIIASQEDLVSWIYDEQLLKEQQEAQVFIEKRESMEREISPISQKTEDSTKELESQSRLRDVVCELTRDVQLLKLSHEKELETLEKKLKEVQQEITQVKDLLNLKNLENSEQYTKICVLEKELKELRFRAQDEVDKRDSELEAQRKILVTLRAERFNHEKSKRNNETPDESSVVSALGESQNLYYEGLISKKNTEITDLTRKSISLELKLEEINQIHLEKQITSLEKERVLSDEIRTLKNDAKLRVGNELEYLRNIFTQYIQCVDHVTVQSKSILKAMGSVLEVSPADLRQLEKK